MMKLKFTGQLDELSGAIAHLSEVMDFTVADDGVVVELEKLSEGGLKIEKKGGMVSLSYGIIPDFCRALCFLLDELKKGSESFKIEEKRLIPRGGIMPDVSRNAVYKVKTAKDIISRIARMGMNTFVMYMEDVYKVEKYPYFGYLRGAYTKEELKEIDQFGQMLGVEVVPCIQTLSHLKKPLWWNYAANIRDTAETLLVDEPETYEFIEAMISTISECFTTRRIHIGMDEAFDLGTGEYKRRHGTEIDKFGMLSRHLNRVRDIVKKYNMEPMMWADMFFRLASSTANYYDDNISLPESIKEQIPNDVTMVYWDYYTEDEAAHDLMIKKHQALGNDVSYFGGIWTWAGLSVNYNKTFRATPPALHACHRAGIGEICATLWADDGGETSVYEALLGMQLYAEYIYYPDVSMEHLEKMFRICTGYEMETFLLFDADHIKEVDEWMDRTPGNWNTITITKQAFCQDILMGMLDKQFEHLDLTGHYKELYEKLEKAEFPKDLAYLFEYHKQFVKVMTRRGNMGNRLRKAYLERDMEEIERILVDLKILKEDMERMLSMMAEIWYANNNAIGFDRQDLRIGGLIMRTQRAIERVSAWANGEVERLEELDEPRLKYVTSRDYWFHQYSEKFLTFSV
ncbi:MAG: beta-N-acetylhexosaminidase [Clostridia bacterium]|nr:beta-N-acetylhexosaminidase [Clostridia bacterium]